MQLTSLMVRHVRRVSAAELEPTRHVNLIIGRNGSGKTSLLEAIHYLATARSFRTGRALDVIAHGEPSLVVSGEISTLEGQINRIGVEKTRDSTRLHLNGETVTVASKIARLIPILMFNTDSYLLLEGGPSNRRTLLDRLLFHVEPDYLDVLKSYYRGLKQRNALLRAKMRVEDALPWHELIAEAASKIDHWRRECATAIDRYVQVDPISPEIQLLGMEYRRGWSDDDDLAALLQHSWGKDIESGMTSVGPHRAELKIKINSKLAKNTVSRGQGKLIISAIICAQARYLQEDGGEPPILLVDDLASELDSEARTRAMQRLLGTQAQVFFTAIDPDNLRCDSSDDVAMFHVEQGNVRSSILTA